MSSVVSLDSRNPLTRKVVTLSGREYEVSPDMPLRVHAEGYKSLTIKFDYITKAHLAYRKPLFDIFCDLLHTHSESYVDMQVRALQAALQYSDLFQNHPIPLQDISGFINSNAPNSYQPFIRPLLARLNKSAPSLFEAEAASFLEGGVKWEEQNGQYFALMTNCPESGALTEQELHNLNAALNRAYSDKRVTLTNFALMWMFIGTGLRPIQIARMKRSDVVIHEGPEGKEVMLQVPLAKGEGKNNDFWLRRAPSVLAEVLVNYINCTASCHDDDATLFLDTSLALRLRMMATANKLNTWSDRLGTSIPITPYRLRYTLATRALAQGASDHEVARLLTHRSTSCISYYRSSMPEMLDPIESALGKEMAYFARAFQGRLINDLSEATRKDEGEAEIMDFVHLTHPNSLGACGTHALCYQNAPIACLSCPRFEPYKDAPWEDLLGSLKDDAARESDDRIKLINLNAMSAINEIILERDRGASNG